MNEVITIVSGLPRSGTSMMMRMLEAGGMNVVVDNIRRADEDNPHGYFELEKVKEIKTDSSWLEGVKGKAFKMVSMLLYSLPPEMKYKIVFMRRNMEEILASQRKMLERQGLTDEAGHDDGKMAELFEKHLDDIVRWLADRKNMEVLYVNYNDMMKDPIENIQRVNRFFGDKLDFGKMQAAVDRSLYRQRIKA